MSELDVVTKGRSTGTNLYHLLRKVKNEPALDTLPVERGKYMPAEIKHSETVHDDTQPIDTGPSKSMPLNARQFTESFNTLRNMSRRWYSAGAPEYEQKPSKSIIHTFSVRGYRGLTINPYQGCQHRCAYCYATYEWSPEFYDKIYAKSNAPDILDRELAMWKGPSIDPVMVSSATDAYQPAELRYGLTRRCIQVLQKYNVPYYVFTKSAIIERDLTLHSAYKQNCFIVWSITTCNEKIRRIIEPGTGPAARIFEVIEKFSRAGVRCGVNIDPIMPLVTDSEEELVTIVDACKQAGVRHVFGSLLRLRTDIWDRMKMALALLGIDCGIERYKKIYGFTEPVHANYLACARDYERRIIGMLDDIVRAAGLSRNFPDNLGPKEIDKTCTGQQSILHYVKHSSP